ncbi:MAG: flagellar biosynthesis anti-sigma factor FlgM [Chloroflexi bacterium HGW-Chloroflexi-9]|nr:MAG: flagellar biosynthesis anti-sigma factor FlgM [Chloroflexi bacterium HGW-Chloroflexi-9]
MNIDPTGPAPLRPVQATPSRPWTGEQPAAPVTRGGQHDRIDLSTQARQLAAIESPDERAARVEALRAAVQDGTYQVDADELASRIAEQGDA